MNLSDENTRCPQSRNLVCSILFSFICSKLIFSLPPPLALGLKYAMVKFILFLSFNVSLEFKRKMRREYCGRLLSRLREISKA